MIKIAVVSYNNETPTSPISALFGPEQATIGRSDDNFLCLPDPKHFVSRAQAKVWSDGTQHQLINTSLANPILINGKEIEPERMHDIHVGDQIQIGLYLLRVDAVDSSEFAVPARPPQMPTKMSPPAKTAQVKNTVTTSMAKTTLQPPQFLLRTEETPAQADDFSSKANSSESPPPSEPKPASPMLTPAATSAADSGKPVEPGKADASALLQAFLNGAGLPTLNVSSGLTEELMETMGKLVATSVRGTMELIAQRALVKREVNAEVTMVVLRKNNPLKFFPDSQTVLTQMLRKKMPGFMAPAEAMEDAFLDLRAHQLGVIAGMRAAMDALLKKLQPINFEQQLEAPTLLDYLNPARRKAAMWNHFSDLFDTISLEAKDEFQSLFGKEFVIAYEDEVERARHDSPAS